MDQASQSLTARQRAPYPSFGARSRLLCDGVAREQIDLYGGAGKGVRREGRGAGTGIYGLTMTRFAIDALTLVHLVRGGHTLDPAHSLVAPNSIRSDALDHLLQEVRSGQLAERAALDLDERITQLKIRLLGDRVSRRAAWKIARDQDGGTVRHAEYLAVAKLQADALITIDAALASQARGIVPLGQFADLLASSGTIRARRRTRRGL